MGDSPVPLRPPQTVGTPRKVELILQTGLELRLPKNKEKMLGQPKTTMRLKNTDIFTFHIIFLLLFKGEGRKAISFKA